ncbi:hypothetical protein, partial [Pseudomonas savastanoi]|uniref:hypothetical protein n=1 Tax=Pseudomonas savastanoi TaxID=29438 RepID=UPI001A9D6328
MPATMTTPYLASSAKNGEFLAVTVNMATDLRARVKRRKADTPLHADKCQPHRKKQGVYQRPNVIRFRHTALIPHT